MTHFNSKEDAFKDILGNLELGIDTERLWDDVQDKLPSKKNDEKLPLGFWLVSGVAFSCLLVVMVIALTQSDNEIRLNENINLLSNKEAALASDVFSSTKAYEAAIDRVVQAKEVSEQTIKLVSESNKTLHSQIKNQFASSINNASFATSNPVSTYHFQSISSVDRSNTAFPLTSPKVKAAVTSPSLDTPLVHVEYDQRLQLISILKSKELVYDNPVPDITGQEFYIQPIAQQKKLQLSYTLLSGVNKGLSSYFGSKLPDNENTTERLNTSEVDLPGLSNQLTVSGDYGYWRFNLGLKHNYNAARFEKERVVIQAVERTVGTESFSERSIFNNTERWHRLHNSLDLQIGIGRIIFTNEKYKLSANVASSFNILTRSSGYYFNEFLFDITSIEGEASHPYKKSRGFGGSFDMTIERKIGKHLSLAIQPNISTVFNPINNNTIHYKLKNSQVGLLIGISYRPVWE